MLPSSNNNINGNNPIDQTLLFSNLYHFPSSPYIHYETDDFFLQQYLDLPLITTDHNTNASDTNVINTNMADSNKIITISPPRKRCSKRDRHSKIHTAQGPRDRRMRLSLDIAREFFGLQDKLGFDKASKTVEWLLSKAKNDIMKLIAKSRVDSSSTVVVAKSTSSASECEVISEVDDHLERAFTEKLPTKCANKEKIIRLREVRKAAFCPVRARESREKARARARERTRKKMCGKSKLFAEDATTNQDSNQVASSRTSPMSLEVEVEVEVEVAEVETRLDMVDDDHSLVTMEKWSPTSSIFNYLHSSTGISQEHQFADFHFYGKPWEESYNIQSLL